MATVMGLVAARALDEAVTDPAPKGEKRLITRNRTSYSCQTCRRRKIKCDKQHPVCGSCQKSNESCVYGKLEHAATTPARGGQVAKRRSSFTSSGRRSPPSFYPAAELGNGVIQGLEQQLNRLTTLVETIQKESAGVHGPRLPPTPASLVSHRDTEDDNRAQSQHSDSPSVGSDAAVQRAGELSASLSELDIAKQKSEYVVDTKGRFWAHLADELQQLRYLIKGSQAFPTEQPLKNAMGLEISEQSDHNNCDGSRNPVDPNAIVDEPIDIHQYQQVDADFDSDRCWPCHVKSGDKSVLLLSRRLRKLDIDAAEVNLLSNVPTEAQSNVLFRAWVTGVWPALPVLPLRLTFRRYEQFWSWKNKLNGDTDKETETPDMYTMTALHAIWYTGALSLSTRGFQRLFPGLSRAHLCAQYHDQCVRLLTTLSFPTNNQTWLLATMVMLQSAPCGEEDPLQNSDYVNLMVRLAQAQGLHREPTLAELHPMDAEIRRRIWWQIMQLDTSLAVASGFPTCTSEETSDVRPISQVKEMFIGSDEEKSLLQLSANGGKKIEAVDDPFGPSTSISSTSALVSRTYASIAVATRKLVSLHMRTRPVNKIDLLEMNQIISATETEVRDVINSIPTKGVPEFGFTPDVSTTRLTPPTDCDPMLEGPLLESEITFWTGIMTEDLPTPLGRFHRQRLAAFHKWARIFLSMMCDKLHCIAYAPFLKNLRSKLWDGGRQCALHHTSAYFRKFISLAKDPAMQAFRWSWPGTAQPMHAAIILLVDVYERPQSVEAARSRALIDEVFSLSDPESGIVGGPNGASAQRPFREGGADAWEMLRNLRASAWRKAGLDPNALWTQEQQVLGGVAQPLTSEQKIAQSLREDTLYEGSTPEPSHKLAITTAISGLHRDMETAEQARLHATDNTKTAHQPNGPQPPADPAAKRLVRLPGQQSMPFPLLTQQPPQHPAPVHVPGPANHIDATRYDGEAPEEWQEAERHATQQLPQQPRAALKPFMYQAPNGGDVAMTMAQSYTTTTTTTTNNNNASSQQLPTNGSIPGPHPSVGQQVAMNFSQLPGGGGGGGGGALTAGSGVGVGAGLLPSDHMDFEFDWDAWDAVFSQYSGYADFLDEVDHEAIYSMEQPTR
ncbi:uncharacterized protein HMPREF1541_01745 [Cyphellophora europaea CBS 101466]|uniref:Zn(2)-C6 fungal-type domain-containing protein n=1 Tax=Cyphellophora europaea (strain CBS 101466) TaxID=1220924 RepID=W2S3H5_CYPE1|nr:uncharacterized protein HMPREF1541_01745 [Cyphellophora europaea CBS 101466]ETN42588.1 hypothetical protein HMPREF1541_01745 [Cyphellophora europaea CBS 101466]